MKKHISAVFFLIAFLSFGQSKIIVLKTGERTPIYNASILCDGKLLGKTDASGTLNFKTKCDKVDVKAPGFYEDEVVVDKIMELSLSKTDPKTQSIEGVVISDKSDPQALAILQKVTDHFKDNAPSSLDSYSFKWRPFSLGSASDRSTCSTQRATSDRKARISLTTIW